MSKLIYRTEVAAQICARIANGTSLSKVCRDKEMPSRPTFFEWVAAHPELAEMYRIAIQCRAHGIFEEILEIADTPQEGVKIKESDKNGLEKMTGDMIDHRRLRVDARKWILARMDPTRYGDRVSTELTGKDGGPVQLENAAAPTLADFYQTVKRIAVDTVKDTAKDDDGNSQV